MWLSQELIAHNQIQASVAAGEAPCELVGEEIQRLSVVLSLPRLLETEESCLTRIVPKVQSALPTGSTELHMAASTAFKQILERKLVNPRTFTQIFLQSILQSLEARDPVVAEAWLETLLDVIDLLPVDVITSDILPIAQSKGQLAQTVHNRLTAGRLLGKMCSRFDQNILKKLALPLVLSLCQDVKAEVRACICAQLPAVAKGLGSEAVKPLLLPSLVELASDEECMVRNAAVETIVRILPHLQRDTLKQTIVPLVKKICESSLRAEDDVMVTMSKVYGELCIGLEPVITTVEKKWFLSHYQMMAQLGVRSLPRRPMPDLVPTSDNANKFSDCRFNCAYHLPAMTVFATSAAGGADSTFYEQLYPTFSDLACDPYFVVRKTIACGMHEVVRVLGNNNGMVKMELVKLLKDEEEEVLNGIIAKLSTTLLLLADTGTLTPDAMDSTAIEIGRSLIKCESVVAGSNDWRLHETLLRQFECLPKVLPYEFLFSHIVTTLFSRIHNARQLPVRLAASRTLLFMLRNNPKQSQKNDIRARIITEMCHARSCHSRMGFIKLAGHALDIFSKKYFKDHFFMHILNSADDKVPNNRLVFVFLLPRLKACLRLPSDKKQLVMLETCVRKLIAGERDRDVAAAVRAVIGQLDKIEVRQDNEKLGTREEAEDNRRMEEENAINNLASTKVDSRAMGLMTKAINEDSHVGGNRTVPHGPTSQGQSVMQRRGIPGQDLRALASLSAQGSPRQSPSPSPLPSPSHSPSPSNTSQIIMQGGAGRGAAAGGGRGGATPSSRATPPSTPRKMSAEKKKK